MQTRKGVMADDPGDCPFLTCYQSCLLATIALVMDTKNGETSFVLAVDVGEDERSNRIDFDGLRYINGRPFAFQFS